MPGPNPLLATAKTSMAQGAAAHASPTRYGVPGTFPAAVPGVRSYEVDQNASPVGPAGQLALRDNVTGAPCFPGESQSDCNARAARVRDSGGRDYRPGATNPAPGGLTPAQQNQLINLGSNLIGASATVIAAAIQSGNQLELARLQARATERLGELANEAAATRSETERAQLELQRGQLEQMLALLNQQRLSSSGLSTGAWIAIGIGAAAVLGTVAYVATAGPRRNPSASRENPVVGTGRNRHYVSPEHYRARRGRKGGKGRGKRGKRRAAA